MTFRVVLFAFRKAGLTPQDFKHHYETVHVPLVRQMTGSLFPLAHSRRYISRLDAPEHQADENQKAEVISGEASEIPYDAITEMKFETRDDFYKFAAILNEPANALRIADDCAAFLDTTKISTMVVLEDICESTRDSE